MNKNITNKLLIIVFLVLITLPQSIFYLININKETTEISTDENRKLNSKLKLELATITNYPDSFDNYYNDHLPFREKLRTLWVELNYEIFNISVDDRVLIRKDGWLFFRGDQSIEQAQGIINYTEEEKKIF